MISSLIGDVVSLLFPMNCFACAQPLVSGEEYICTDCKNDLPQVDNHDGKDNDVARKFEGVIMLKYAFAYLAFRKSGIVQSVIHHLKYRDHPQIGATLGRWLAGKLIDQGLHKEWDVVLPVPLHISKLRHRGYNQSDYFAQGLSEAMNIPWSNKVLRRTKKNTSQTNKGRWERHLNVDRIFTVKDREMIKMKRVLLVDDIITTGATLQACALPLLEGGVKELSVAVIALSQ